MLLCNSPATDSLVKFCKIACGYELAAYGKEIAEEIARILLWGNE